MVELVDPLDRALRSTRVLVRHVAVSAYKQRAFPPSYPMVTRELAAAVDLVADELQADRMAVAAQRGLIDPGSLDLAARLSTADHDDFEQLPTSCAESADALESARASFEALGVFPSGLVDGVLARLRADDDRALMKRVRKDDDARAELVRRHWHVG